MPFTSRNKAPAKTAIKGFTLYEGASVLDGKPIVVLATLETSNAKTGAMVQTWILRSDVEPHQAVKTGDDVLNMRRKTSTPAVLTTGKPNESLYQFTPV